MGRGWHLAGLIKSRSKLIVFNSWPVWGTGCMIVLLMGLAYWLISRQEGELPNGGLWVEAKYLDLGEVWEQEEPLPWLLPIHNSTAKTLEIGDWVTSCACLAIEPRRLPLPAGHTEVVKLALNTAATAPRPGVIHWPLAVHLIPRLKEIGTVQPGWVLRGTVKKVLFFDPPEWDFAERLVCGQPWPAARVAIQAQAELQEIRWQAEEIPVQVRLWRSEEDAFRFFLEVLPQPCLPVGSFTWKLRLVPVSRGGKLLPVCSYVVRGRVVEEVEAYPERLEWGRQEIGRQVREVISLRARRGQCWEVEGVKTSSETLQVEALASQRNEEERYYAVVGRIDREGEQEEQVIFSIRVAGSGRRFPLVVPVRYWGQQGQEGVVHGGNERVAGTGKERGGMP
jgi:hypothetical protein